MSLKTPDTRLLFTIKFILLIQLLILAVVALVAGLLWGVPDALATLYGGVCAIAMVAMLGSKMKRLSKHLEKGRDFNFSHIMLGFIPRFCFILLAFLLGIGGLDLPPVPLISSYAILHIAYLLSFRLTQKPIPQN